ncbi:MAG: exported protein of unknown function [Candidatus Saccharibacteria bacterium]|nr:exported protein of unknown function [Candidatus Saccharibacteria bacterium]
MIRGLVTVLLFSGYLLFSGPNVHAEPVIGLQPLQYVETIEKGERKQAFIDVTNPSSQAVLVQFNVQAFKQVDDKGGLSFYADEKISNGILLDYQEKQIPARKTLRLFFIVDGAKLPTGDVFAAVFAQTKPEQVARLPSVRIGTLLILTNGTPGARKANIESLTAPLIQLGNSIRGEIKIKNTAPANTASGFFPEVTVDIWPFGPKSTITGPLIYTGNTRTISLDQPSNQMGIYKVTANYGDSVKAQWMLVITGIWRWILLGAFIAIAMAALIYKLRHRRRRIML